MRDEQGLFADERSTERLARGARAAKDLCDVLWESLHEELRAPDSARVKQLSERLSEVPSTIALLADGAGGAPVERRTPPEPVGPQPPHDPRSAPAHGPGAESAHDRRAEPPHDPRAESPHDPRSAAPQSPPTEPPHDPPPGRDLHLAYTFTRLVDEHHSTPTTRKPLAPVETLAPRIDVHDVRREEGPSAWISSLGRLLQRHAVDRLPFAVLLIELVDVARLERTETPHDMHGIVRLLESALGRGMRATDELARETLGRYWLVAPDTDATGAHMLAERLAHLVRTSASHRGVPLEVAIGIAMCPDDGVDAPALAARADLGVYSARATGQSIARTEPPRAG